MQLPHSLFDHLKRAAQATPARLALLAGDSQWDYAGLCTMVEQTARATAGEASICSGNSLELALAAYAASFQNRPFFPVDPRASSCLYGRSNADKPTISSLAGVALMISTSGSSGQPRTVLLGNAQLDAAAAAANTRLALASGDRWLNCLPLYHIGGQSILWRCARAGATVLLHDGFVAEAVARDLTTQPVTHISLVPAMLARLLELSVTPPPTLRVAMIGGAALSLSLYERAQSAGWPLYVSYGMSETAAQIATFGPDDCPWREGLVGRPMPGHEIALAADGRVRIRGPQLMRGYLDGSGLDADGWLTTGDLGEIDADGRLSILGRADDMLISGGRNVHPQEVESCLAACPGVADIAVTGLPDPVWGDLVVALVVGPVAPAALLAHARRSLPSAALPRRIRHVERLPRNAAGKIDRRQLKQLAIEAGA